MKQSGMTLIELVVAMALVAMLTAIAVPSYRGFVQRSQRVEAKEALVHLAANQEKFYLQNNTYSNDLEALGFGDSLTEHGLYEVEVVAADTQGFTIRATPASGSGASGDADCQVFVLNEANEQSASPDGEGKCW